MKNSVRWLPAIVAPVLIAAGAIAIPAVANASSPPPEKTAQQVLALVSGAEDAAYSGTIAQTSDLGLPQLPSTGAGSSATGSDATSQVLDLLTADHTARLFVDGASKQRVQVLDSLAERDVVRNGDTVWTYDSKTKKATHLRLSGHRPSATGTTSVSPSASPDAEALSPAQLADRFITAIEPSTRVSVTSTSSVAGRPVYRLTLTPKTGTTLVSRVTLSVDAATGLPLKVAVDARGQSGDAFTVGFTSIDFSTPAASLFDFTPPKGAKVSTPDASSTPPAKPDAGAKHPTHAKPTVTGTGWSTIIELPAGAASAGGSAGGSTPGSKPATPSAGQSKLLDELTTPVDGGRALQTSLLSVLQTSDGRLFIGAVPIASLEAAAQ